MRIITDPKYDFDSVLIRPKRSELTSRKDVSLNRTYKFLNSGASWTGTPIIAANMDHTGTLEMAKAIDQFGMMTALHKHYPLETLINEFKTRPSRLWYSMGVVENDMQKFEKTIEGISDGETNVPPFVCVDVANGYTETFVNFIKRFREDHPSVTIMAGNVVTGEMTEQLILAGADVVKVGIGPGSVCTTRKITGVGYPQLSAVIECADAAHGIGGHICADGGCTTPGDVAKAFGAGADFVMLGGMLAGHDECDGEVVTVDEEYTNGEFGPYVTKPGKQHMKFYGMSSKAAMEKHSGGVAEYRASEGKEVLVPYRGPVCETVKEILGGVRSACTYTGSKTLKELPKRTTFVLVNQTHNKVFGE